MTTIVMFFEEMRKSHDARQVTKLHDDWSHILNCYSQPDTRLDAMRGRLESRLESCLLQGRMVDAELYGKAVVVLDRLYSSLGQMAESCGEDYVSG